MVSTADWVSNVKGQHNEMGHTGSGQLDQYHLSVIAQSSTIIRAILLESRITYHTIVNAIFCILNRSASISVAIHVCL